VLLRAEGEPTVYVAGDTVLCDEARGAGRARPGRGGGQRRRRALHGRRPITMDADDVVGAARAAPDAEVVAVDMEAVNHCLLTRAELRARLEAEGLADRVHVPADGTALAT
jgi:hypothetical protein